jgi:hypothetical protein
MNPKMIHLTNKPWLRIAAAALVAATAVSFVAPASADAVPFTIGANFTGTDLSAIGTSFPEHSCVPGIGLFTCVPPDTMGAVGPNHVGELINSSFAVYDKTGALQTRMTLPDFWNTALANSGTAATSRGPFDPRLLYDPSSSRWYAVSIDMDLRGFTDSQLFVGVTIGDDPSLENWRGFAIDMDPTDALFADFPTIGLDQTALYISNNMYPPGSGGINSISLVGVPKTSLTAETPSIAGFRVESGIPKTNTGRSMQPAVDLDGGSSPLEALGEPSYSSLKRTLIPGDWISGASNIPAPVAGDTLSLQQYDPPDARQPGPYDNIDTFDNRFSSNVILQNGSLWAVQSTNVGGRAAINFLEIDGTSPTATFRQKITISDPSLDLYYPSVAVNDLGDVVIGFSGSDNNTPISTYVVVGTTTGGVTEFGPITQTHAGMGEYQNLDPFNRNRWGDYSATVLDPSKPRTFWTFQEFAAGDTATTPSYSNWAVRVTEITVLPDSPIMGDYNGDATVDAADYVVWRDTLGLSGSGLAADGNGDLVVDNWDYGVWRAHFGETTSVPGAAGSASAVPATPEPAAWLLLVIASVVFLGRRRLTSRGTKL